MLSSVVNKPTNPYPHPLAEGFLSTQSMLSELFDADPGPGEFKRIIQIDVSELYYRVHNDQCFALLTTYIPSLYLFGDCWDFDRFYQLLSDLQDNADQTECDLVANDKVYDELECQGFKFVELYRNDFILPAVRSVNGESTFCVGGMNSSQQLIISY